MKKIFILALAIASIAMVSCQKTEVINGNANVSIKVGFPETKVISDGTTATNLVYEVYHVDETKTPAVYTLVSEDVATLVNLTATLDFTLMRNNKYVALFWAQSPMAPYGTDDLRAVKMNYVVNLNGNNENRDAFAGKVEFTVTDNDTQNNALYCPLTRPFSQINFVASDYEKRDNDNIEKLNLTHSLVTISAVATDYNVLTGTASNTSTDPGSYFVKYEASSTIVEEFDTNYKDNTWISMNYVLLPNLENEIKVSAEFNVTATYKTGSEINHVITFPETAVKAGVNYRTNIIGELFTEGGEINIEVKPGYAKPDNTLNID